jgi:alpha/beta superfamily hydrolase
MYNAIVEGLCRSLEMSGLVALRFNFRGVGASEGAYDRGIGEVRDVKAAFSFLRSLGPPRITKMGVAGYSF